MPKDKDSSKNIKGGHRQLHVKVKSAKGRKSSSTKWLQRQLNDPYVQLAHKEGFRSRAAYKLIEIDKKFHLLKPGISLVDLGAAPGGWLQVAVKRCKGSKIIGIDLQEIEPIPGVRLLQQDFLEDEALDLLEKQIDGKKINLVLSDMAAPACGHAQTDHLRIIALCEAALDFALQNLQPGGSFVAKVLAGGTQNELLDIMKKHFTSVKHFKPESSRKDSAELYVVAQCFKGKTHE